MNSHLKVCSICGCEKDLNADFYMCSGRYRSECKVCTIKRNAVYQKKKQPWLKRFSSSDEHKSYMAEYYHNNREKFLEYRKTFNKKHPNYYKDYQQKRKSAKRNDKKNLDAE